MFAHELYGSGQTKPLSVVGGGKGIGAGAPVPAPDAVAAPAASFNMAAIGDVFDDPTFWLVASIGLVFALAAASR